MNNQLYQYLRIQSVFAVPVIPRRLVGIFFFQYEKILNNFKKFCPDYPVL